MATTITTRVEDSLAEEIDTVAEEEAIDRSAVIRRFLISSIKEWKIQQQLQEYEEGKITLWGAARACDISLWEMMDKAAQRKVRVPYTMEALEEDLRAL